MNNIKLTKDTADIFRKTFNKVIENLPTNRFYWITGSWEKDSFTIYVQVMKK